MSKIPKICFDKILPHEMRASKSAGAMRTIIQNGRPRAIMPKGKRWANGSKLGIRFLGGTTQQQESVVNVAAEWEKFANVQLDFNEAPDAEIRISFLDDGAWSYLGTDNLDIPRHAATMNFGFMGDGTILHEFGHALGLAHEHQSPHGGMQWNEQAVIDALSGPPNNWDLNTIRHNVFQKYSVDQINGTDFDQDSIMLYAFPAGWTTNGVATRENHVLSATDKEFIGSVYPKDDAAAVVNLTVSHVSLVSASIKESGEEDLYSFDAAEVGDYVVETRGNTDVVMKLFGPDSNTNLIAEDDDSGELRNARIQVELARGKYLVQVRHFGSGTGDYQIAVSKR